MVWTQRRCTLQEEDMRQSYAQRDFFKHQLVACLLKMVVIGRLLTAYNGNHDIA
jgi:hypothetical protein